jgi:hypothetical protein
MNKHYDVELYQEGEKYCAYIGSDDGASGYKIKRKTVEELTQAIAQFFADEIDD